jgi:hypothetical protein
VAIIDDTVTDESGQPVIVRIEVAENSVENYGYDRQTRGGPQVVERAKDAFKDSLQLIHTCATQISTTLHTIPPQLQPREYEVQFSIKIDGKVGAFIAESTAGAQLQVTLRWGEKEQK